MKVSDRNCDRVMYMHWDRIAEVNNSMIRADHAQLLEKYEKLLKATVCKDCLRHKDCMAGKFSCEWKEGE